MRKSLTATGGGGGAPCGPPPPPFDPATWTPPRRELAWLSTFQPYRSFGLVARALVTTLEPIGVAVAAPGPAPRGLDSEFARRFRPPSGLRGHLVFNYSYHFAAVPLPSDRVVVYTTRESTHIPPVIVETINRTAALCCVPCRQNRDAYRAAGVAVPIRVLPHGVDGEQFPLLDRPRAADAPFVFGTVGDFSLRKGIDVLLRAFRAEFAPDEPVRLLLKNLAEEPVPEAAGDPRVEQVVGYAEHGYLLALLGRMDAFVLPSRGEGFGLTGLEAMATGLPLIATNWSGPADYLDPADSLPLAYRLVEAGGVEVHGVRFDGLWAEPDEAHLRTLLRWVYEHRDETAAMGQLAAARVRREWTWDHAAMRLRDDLDTLATGISPA